MRRAAAFVVVGVMLAVPRSTAAWGFEGHKYIMAAAIPRLPEAIRPFFLANRTFVVEHTVDPDLWRTAGWEQESPRHFVDLDAYGTYPFPDLPHVEADAVARYGQPFVDKNGTLPWRAEEIYRKLVEAFAQKTPYARENIKFFSSIIGHYVADAHVPFHAVMDYDGQATGQGGIHARFESELFDRYRARLVVRPGPRVPVPNVRELIFSSLLESFTLVPPILAADKAAVAGRDTYDDQYFSLFFAKVRPTLEQRLGDSIRDVDSVITAAWIEAGRPAVPIQAARQARPVKRQ